VVACRREAAVGVWTNGMGVCFIGAHLTVMRSQVESVSARHDRAVACTRALWSEVALAQWQR
jgi:hypothetical protein